MTSFMTAQPVVREVDADLVARSDAAIRRVKTDPLPLGRDGERFAVADPATEVTLVDVPVYTVDDARRAIDRADSAQRAWAARSPRHRSDVLHDVYSHLMAHQDELALVITREMGKPIGEARAEVQYAADYVRWYAEAAVRAAGNFRRAPRGGSAIITTRVPIGTTLLITPWNFPMAMATRKIAPALAAGCSALVKPAALTPLTTLFVSQLMIEAGVPADLIQVLTTNRAGEFSRVVMSDDRVRKISFTGSTGVGVVLLEQAAKTVMKTSMELGGNASLLIFDDADVERAVEGAIQAKLRNGGQSCVAANRILVQDGIADDFVELFTARMASVRLGNGLADGTALGPVINSAAVESMTALVDDAAARGARVLTGGHAPAGGGHFFEATVLDVVTDEMAIANTEIFGPVAAISRFGSQQEGIDRANATPFGLAGYVFSESIDRCFEVGSALNVGMVGVNSGVVSNVAAPFGGVKQSGLGREGSEEGLEEYQEIQFFNLGLRQSL